VVRRIARLSAGAGPQDAVSLGLVDAVLDRDAETLSAALDALRAARTQADGDHELSGWIDAATAFAHWGLERAPSQAGVAPGTQAHDFLSSLAGSPQLGSSELRSVLAVDETQVSRTGRRLLDAGLVTRRKVGRQVFWQLTPRGRRAVDEAPASAANSEFWQEALRRGFDGAPRELDPLRRRLIESTLDLHLRKGIAATTYADVAQAAAVPVETVEEQFPTQDDLVRSCGEHFFEGLRLPPRDRAPDVFEAAASENERIRLLVRTLFGAYERGADGITAARRERKELVPLGESVAELDATFDALVREAVRSDPPVAPLRAITDVEVWRSLRHQGATPEAAVDEGTAAVERWLAAHA
jgi:DNA-binding MarR family transcriptional regulator